MKSFSVTYYAPYTFANFKGQAESIEQAQKIIKNYNDKNRFCILNREVKSEKFDGKKAHLV